MIAVSDFLSIVRITMQGSGRYREDVTRECARALYPLIVETRAQLR